MLEIGVHELKLESIFEDQVEEEKVTGSTVRSHATVTSSEQLRNLEA